MIGPMNSCICLSLLLAALGNHFPAQAVRSAPATPITFKQAYSVGDRVRVYEANVWNVRLEEASDDVQVGGGHRYRLNWHQYVDELHRVDAGGRPEYVTRTFSHSTNSASVPDVPALPVPTDLAGKVVVIRRDHGVPTILSPATPNDDEARILSVALGDDFDSRILTGTHAIGDEWTIGSEVAAGYLTNPQGEGRCRLVGMATHGGEACAAVTVNVRLRGTEIIGRFVTTNLTGTILWSPRLHRTVSVLLRGGVSITATRLRGATTTVSGAVGTIILSRELVWLKADGKVQRGR